MSHISRHLAPGLPNAKDVLGDRFTTARTDDDKLWFISRKGVDQPTISYFHETPLRGGHVVYFDIPTKTWSRPMSFPTISDKELLEGEVFGVGNRLLLLSYQKSGQFSFRDLYEWRSDQWKKVDQFKVGEETTFDCGERAMMKRVTDSGTGDLYFVVEYGANLIVVRFEISQDGNEAEMKLVREISDLYPSYAVFSPHIVKAAIHDHHLYAIYGQQACGFQWNPTQPLRIDLRDGKVERVEMVSNDQLEHASRPPWSFSGPYAAHLLSPSRWYFFGGCRAHGLNSVQDDRSIWQLDLVGKEWKRFKACDLPAGAVLVGVKNTTVYCANMSAKRGVDFVRQYFAAMAKSSNFQRLGSKVKVVSGGNGNVVGELTVEKEHENDKGTLHGGVTAALVDIVTTAALMTTDSGRPGVSVDLNVSYISAVKSGETIVIDANVIREGKTLAYTTADIRKKIDGKIVAMARHTKAFPAPAKATDSKL